MLPKKKQEANVSEAAKPSPRQEVDRLIAKGWFKDAIKQAKLVHRADPTPEHHRLLEQAYFLRAEELRDKAMTKSAQEVASQLLDFGITDSKLIEPAAALFMAVGLERQALDLQKRLDTPETLDRLTRLASDQAVLHPERAAATPEIRDGAKRVRAALEALATATADGPDPLDALRDISRNSPFADWRLFARGMVAFRRGDVDDAKANWDRLDANRAASKIARTLLGSTSSDVGEGPSSTKLDAVERKAFGEPVLGPLRELSDLVGQGQWPGAVRKLTLVRLVLRRFDPRLAVRLTEALYSLVIREATGLGYNAAQELLKGFVKAAEPLPIDPRWNRFWAMVWEGPQGHPEESGTYWSRYIDDLATLQAIQPEERPIAQALVMLHHGLNWAGLAEDIEGGGPKRVVDPEANEARRNAVALFEKSLTLFPSHRPTYQAMMDAYEEGGQTEKALEVAERLLQVLPDDLETLVFLSDTFYKRDEPVKGLEFALRARKLKPLDPKIIMSEWACRISLARQLAFRSQWDEARAELTIAAGLNPELAVSTHFSARRACFEIKAGATDTAKKIIDEAVTRLAEPTPLWLAMAIEAQRFQLPKAEIDRYEIQWKDAVLGKVRGETAGALAKLILPFHTGGLTYPSLKIHTDQLIKYFERTTRVKYNREDLASVCDFISLVTKDHDLIAKLAKRGVKLFPQAAEFSMILGTVEMAKGPFKANLPAARQFYETALKLAQAEETTNPRMAGLIPGIKKGLTLIQSVSNGPLGGGRMGGLPASFMEAMAAMMDEMGAVPEDFFDDDDDDDFDDDDGWGPGPAPAPLPAPTSSPRPKKKKKKKR